MCTCMACLWMLCSHYQMIYQVTIYKQISIHIGQCLYCLIFQFQENFKSFMTWGGIFEIRPWAACTPQIGQRKIRV